MSLTEHLKHVLLDLHASWVMWILLVLSLASILVTVERALFFRNIRDDISGL